MDEYYGAAEPVSGTSGNRQSLRILYLQAVSSKLDMLKIRAE